MKSVRILQGQTRLRRVLPPPAGGVSGAVGPGRSLQLLHGAFEEILGAGILGHLGRRLLGRRR